MHRTGLTELEVVIAVARRQSFRGAARELGMSATAVSNAVAGLESRLQVRLFHRSTRSVSLTDVGQRYVERITPAIAEIQHATDEIGSQPDALTGTLRINAPPEVATRLFEPLLSVFAHRHPGVRLDFVSEARPIDIVADGFDAGIRLAESVPLDMIAIALTGEMRQAVVASPDYLARHGAPQTPDDLLQHQGLLMRFSNGSVYRWELEKDGKKIEIAPPARMIFTETRLIQQAAVAGFGLAFVSEWTAAEHLASGRLVRLLDDWCKPFDGLQLYYSGQRYVPACLRAFIDLIREKPLVASQRNIVPPGSG